MPSSVVLVDQSLLWFKVCWLLVSLALASVFLQAPSVVMLILYGAAALSGAVSAAYLERVKPTVLTDFVWSLTPVALFLFPIALVLHSVRIYRTRSSF